MNASPTLAIDIASTAASAFLSIPDVQPQGLFAFRTPAPGKVLATRISEGTALGHTLYLKGTTLDTCIIQPLQAHLRAGLALCLHPGFAALLAKDAKTLSDMGMTVSLEAPESALALESWDIMPESWYKLMEMAGLPRPGHLLVCASESGYLFDKAETRPLASWLAALFARHEGGIPLAEISGHGAAEPGMLRLSAIQRITGAFVLDSAIAFVLGMHHLPSIAGRSCREGVVLLYMGKHFIRAALVYQNRLFALLEMPAGLEGKDEAAGAVAGAMQPQALMQWLDDLRLGWLPIEKAEAAGGFLCRAENFPAEAEGFRPLFITGPDALRLENLGRITDSGPEESANCRGLIAAFAGNNERRYLNNKA